MRRPARWVALVAIVAVTTLVAREITSHGDSVLDVVRGTEDAFLVEGLHPRENLVGGAVIRWTKERAVFNFADVPTGPATLTIEARDHRGTVRVFANGALCADIGPGERIAQTGVVLGSRHLRLVLEADSFEASGRTLGTQLQRIRVAPERSQSARAAVTAIALLGAFIALRTGDVTLTLVAPFVALMLVTPFGLWRSHFLVISTVSLGLLAFGAGFVARRAKGSAISISVLGFVLFAALTLHVVIPPSPLVVQGDAQFHANRLSEVAGGNYFITSQTQHSPPFRFPYGFSFYALLKPLAMIKLASPVTLVRQGAAVAAGLSLFAFALALLRLFPVSTPRVIAAILLWAVTPANVHIVSYGNLSNVAAQAVYLGALATLTLTGSSWGFALATLLATLSATAHLSGFFVVAALAVFATVPGLGALSDRSSKTAQPFRIATALAAIYYATFARSMMSQVSRLLSERGGGGGKFDPLRVFSLAKDELGLPLLALLALAVVLGGRRSVTEVSSPRWPLLTAQLRAGLALALLGLISPLEVRYFLALVPALVVIASTAFARDESSPSSSIRFGAFARVVAIGLFGWACVGGVSLWGEVLPAIVSP